MISIKVEGLRPIKWNFEAIGKRWIDEVGPLMLAALKDAAPAKTGHLRESLTVESKASPASATMLFSDDVFYFPWVTGFEPVGPHNIPNAFGRGPNFGLSGRFDGMFHPGVVNTNDFPLHVWDTMSAAVTASLVAAVQEELMA